MGFSPQLPAYFSLQHPTYHVGSCAAITGKIMHVHVFFVPFAGQRWKKKVTSFQRMAIWGKNGGKESPGDGHLGRENGGFYHILFEQKTDDRR